jgi:glycerophosphoryl diester phosphodiesterase
LPVAVIASLRDQGMIERSIVTSFQLGTVAEAITAGGPPRQVWLITPEVQADVGVVGLCELARGAGVAAVGLRSNVLDADTVAAVRAAGLGIGSWACNDAATIARALDLAIDVFTTDRPDLALELRAERQRGMR